MHLHQLTGLRLQLGVEAGPGAHRLRLQLLLETGGLGFGPHRGVSTENGALGVNAGGGAHRLGIQLLLETGA